MNKQCTCGIQLTDKNTTFIGNSSLSPAPGYELALHNCQACCTTVSERVAKMGQVIHVNFRKNSYSLQQARKFLGSGYFRKALMEWSLEELQRSANAGEAWLTDAGLAYTAILNFRTKSKITEEKPLAQVLQFPVQERKAA